MKKWRKIPVFLLAAVMICSLAGTALAVDKKEYADTAGHWAEEEMNRVIELGLMDGRTETAFAPNENITRAELVMALHRLDGSPSLPGGKHENPFSDVSTDDACWEAVMWASDHGIVSGKGGGRFDPNGDVKRQEIAKILNLFAAFRVNQAELASREDKLSGYADAAKVADWAKPCMNWAIASEFITGVTRDTLVPEGTATRAQAAAILCRYMDDASTGDASKDDPRNGDGIGKNELLVVSFGTSFNDNRAATIGAIEAALEKAFADYSVRRGFTAVTIIEHVYRRDGELMDNVTEALDRALANGVENLLVQPTHLMNGYEYGDLVQELEEYSGAFKSIKIGDPLLTTDEDYTAVAKAMVAATAEFDDGKTAICYMGHGTEAASNGVYDRMQQHLADTGHKNYFVGTVEAHPNVEDVLKMVQAGSYERVVLRPMMIVAGDHANNDMAGDEADSWKSVFAAAGYEVVTEIKGLGELEDIQQLLVSHAKAAKAIGETGVDVEPNPNNTKPSGLTDGTYSIEVTSDSKMFRVVACELTVSGGKMTAKLTLSGVGYDSLFAGTKEEAEKSPDSAVPFAEDAEGKYTYTVPVSALDQELPFAAHSKKNDVWYDRGLTFQSATAKAQ